MERPPRDLVFTFSFVTWDGAAERGMSFAQDRLLEHLLRDRRVGRLVVADPYRSAARRVARTLARRDRPLPARAGLTRFSPLRAWRAEPAGVTAVEQLYAAYGRRLERHARAAGLMAPAVITAHPLIAAYASLEWAQSVTFYATDDWAVHPAYATARPVLEEGSRRLRAGDRRICAVSEALLERIRPGGPACVVPNGVEPREWRVLGSPPAWMHGLPAPRLLYAGTLDSRIDVGQVLETARRFGRGSVVLMGPSGEAAHLRPLRSVANVHIRPAAPREEVVRAIAAADACLIPHRRTPLTEAMSPLKLYEYLAAGRPVAAVDLPGVRAASSPRLVLTGNAGGFAEAVERALALGPAPEQERLAFVADNSWERRHDALLELALGPGQRYRHEVGRAA